MAEKTRIAVSHLDMIERPFYIGMIHTTLYSPQPLAAHVPGVQSDDPDP